APYDGKVIIKTSDEPVPPPNSPIKRIYVNGFIYSQSQNDSPDINGILPNDTIGTTGQLPNHPTGLDLDETVFFDPSIKRNASSNGSVKFVADIEKKWYNA